MRTAPRLKTIIIAALALLLLCLAIFLAVILRNHSIVVPAVHVKDLTTTWHGETSINSGTVSSEVKQPVYLSASDLGGEVLVYNGQVVRAGAPLYEYDTSLLELQEEIYELDLALIKNRIARAKADLSSFKKTYSVYLSQVTLEPFEAVDIPVAGYTTPSFLPTAPLPTATSTDGDPIPLGILDDSSLPYKGEGTLESPYLFFLRSGGRISSDFILKHALATKETPIYSTVEMREGNLFGGDIVTQISIIFWPDGTFEYEFVLDENLAPYDPPPPTGSPDPSESIPPTEPADTTTPPPTTEPPEVTESPEVTDPADETAPPDVTPSPSASPSPTSSHSPSPSPSPTRTPRPTRTPTPTPNTLGLTPAQIRTLYNNMQREIGELEIDQKQLSLNLKTVQKKLKEKTLTSSIDGIITGLISLEEATSGNTALLTVVGTEGYVVTGYMSEFDYEFLSIGQEVDVTSRTSGIIYTGTIIEIGTAPEQGALLYSGGNSLSSYYSFSIYVEADNAFRDGEQVDLAIIPEDDGFSNVYLELAYVAEDSNGSYVLFINETGVLEKAYVETGRVPWGYYVEILSGLKADYYLAFPYASDAREGVRAVPNDLKPASTAQIGGR